MPNARRQPANGVVVRGPARQDQKLAATVATRIVDEVVRKPWPVGAVVGSEADLLERYDVSRAVFREAVRLVEHQHVARMRRGPGGGLVVTEPNVTSVIDAASIYLLRVGARLDELFEARLVIEDLVCEIVAGRTNDEHRAEVRALREVEASGKQSDPRALHLLLARATGNPVLDLFTELLNRLTDVYVVAPREIGSGTLSESSHAHTRIADAVLAGDPQVARRRMAKHLGAEADFIRARRTTRQSINMAVALRGVDGHKRAEVLARELIGAVVGQRLAPGTLIGSETELMEAHEVSRAVLREAVRLLEYHHVARMRRGPGGGLFVVDEDVSAISDIVAVHLTRNDVNQVHLAEARVGVELACLRLAAKADRGAVAARLEQALAVEAEATLDQVPDVVHDLHNAIAGVGGNRVLELLARILIRLTRLQDRQRSAATRRLIRDEMHEAHAGISEALIAGKVDVASERLRSHLEVVATKLRR